MVFQIIAEENVKFNFEIFNIFPSFLLKKLVHKNLAHSWDFKQKSSVPCFNKFIALKIGNSNVLSKWIYSIFFFVEHPSKSSKGTHCYKNAARIQYPKNQKQANKNGKIKLLQKWKWNHKTTVINFPWPRFFNKICFHSQMYKNK